MMKKLTTRVSAFALAALLVLGSLMMVLAASPAVVDDSANIFSADQKAEITSRFDRTGDKTGWQLILYTSTQGVSSAANPQAIASRIWLQREPDDCEEAPADAPAAFFPFSVNVVA